MEKSSETGNPETNTHESTQTQVDIPQQPATELAMSQKTSNKWLVPVLVGLVAVSLGVASYFAYQNHQLRQQNTQTQSSPISVSSEPMTTIVPTSVVSSTTPGISTSNWETYLNTSAGFSIKHPAGWRKIETENWVGFGPQEIGEDVTWGVSYYNKSTKTVAQIKDEVGKQFADRKQTEETINFEGITATKVITTTNQYADWYSVTIIVDSGNMFYVIGNGAQTDTALNKMLTKRTGKDYNVTFEDYYTSFKLLK